MPAALRALAASACGAYRLSVETLPQPDETSVTHDANLLVLHPRDTAAPSVDALEDAPATL
jgi:hypothetical protein